MVIFHWFNNNMGKIVFLAICFVLLVVAWHLLRRSKDIMPDKQTGIKRASARRVSGIVFGTQGWIRKRFIYSPISEEPHILVTAGTGAGKTSSCAIPSICSSVQKHLFTKNVYQTFNTFCIDLAGDIAKACLLPQMLIYAPDAPKMENAVCYDVFHDIDLLSDKNAQNEALNQLSILLTSEPHESDAGKFYARGGRRIITAALIAFYHQGFDFCDICEKIANSGWRKLFREIDESGEVAARNLLNGFEQMNEKEISGCYDESFSKIELFATNNTIKNSLCRPGRNQRSFYPEALEKCSAFLVIPEEKLELYQPLLKLAVSQVFTYISSRKLNNHSKTLLLILDEFVSLGLPLEQILGGVRRFRKRKARILILTQNLSDFVALYGQANTRALLANFKFKLLLGGLNERDSQIYFAELIGRNSRTNEYILAPSDLDRQGKNKAILIFPEGYIVIDKSFIWKNRKLQKRYK
jgi:type IV secretory pathway TraG/TraD family ATPase VirD4